LVKYGRVANLIDNNFDSRCYGCMLRYSDSVFALENPQCKVEQNDLPAKIPVKNPRDEICRDCSGEK